MCGEIGSEPDLLLGLEIVAVAADQRGQGAILAADRVEFLPAGQEVVMDDADDMEAISHNAGIGEVLADQRAVGAG